MTQPSPELCDLDATDARRLIGTKEISPVELLESCIARIEAVDGAVNCMVTRAYDRAREEAKICEQMARSQKLSAILFSVSPEGLKSPIINPVGL